MRLISQREVIEYRGMDVNSIILSLGISQNLIASIYLHYSYIITHFYTNAYASAHVNRLRNSFSAPCPTFCL
jgi:hypothetical protein